MKRGLNLDAYKELGVGAAIGAPDSGSNEQNLYWPAFADILPDTAISVLDFGCGNGYYTNLVAARYPTAKILGVDAISSQLPESQGDVQFRQWDGQTPFDTPDAYDLVISKMTLHYLSDDQLRASVANICRVLAPQAVISISVPHPYDSASYNTAKRTEWDRRHTSGVIRRQVSNTNVATSMFHRDMSTWINSIWDPLKQIEPYTIALDEVEGPDGDMKRLNVTYAPITRLDILDAIYDRLRARRTYKDTVLLVDPTSPIGRELLYGDLSSYPVKPLP